MSDGVETKIGSEQSFSLSMDTPEVEIDNGETTETTPTGDEDNLENVTKVDDDEDASGDTDSEDVDTDEPESDTEEEDADGEEDEEEPLEDLGDFDPENTEAWDARFKTEEGQLNKEALSAEFFKNYEDGNPGMNEGTYDYLESLGITKDMVKDVEALRISEMNAAKESVSKHDQDLMTLAGGPDPLKAALDWGKSGGYDKKAQEKFNKIMKGKDYEAKAEAVELLVSRHSKVPKPKPRQGVRDATKGGSRTQSQKPKPFKNRDEWKQARKDAGSNQAKHREIAKRLTQSDFS